MTSAKPLVGDVLVGAAPVCLFGAGSHGRVVAAQIAARAPKVERSFGDSASKAETVDDVPLRFRNLDKARRYLILVTVGDNAARRRLQKEAECEGLAIGRLVVDSTRYFAAPPGPGAQVLAGAVVNTGAQIGTGVIINTNAIAEHDAWIGDFCHLAPGSVAGCGTVLGNGVFLGTNATILPSVRVAPGCIIGAGAVVTCDLDTPGIYAGVPARPLPMSKRNPA